MEMSLIALIHPRQGCLPSSAWSRPPFEIIPLKTTLLTQFRELGLDTEEGGELPIITFYLNSSYHS